MANGPHWKKGLLWSHVNSFINKVDNRNTKKLPEIPVWSLPLRMVPFCIASMPENVKGEKATKSWLVLTAQHTGSMGCNKHNNVQLQRLFSAYYSNKRSPRTHKRNKLQGKTMLRFKKRVKLWIIKCIKKSLDGQILMVAVRGDCVEGQMHTKRLVSAAWDWTSNFYTTHLCCRE